MQGKVAFTLIVFLFPALIVPLFVLAFLTRLPGGVGVFFTDYSFAFLWGMYLLLLIGGILAYRYSKRRAAQHADADEPRPLTVESQQD